MWSFELQAVCTNAGGVGKRPRVGKVAVGPDGLAGDVQAEPRFHGGPDQAICLYAQEDYAELLGRGIGRAFLPGAFGENFSTTGIDWSSVALGQRFRSGAGLEIEISGPRVPCTKLRRYADELPGALHESGQVGAYARVVCGDTVGAGDSFASPGPAMGAPTLRMVHELLFPQAVQGDVPTDHGDAVIAHPALYPRLRAILESRRAP